MWRRFISPSSSRLKGRCAVGTLAERPTRYTLLLYFVLNGHSAAEVQDAVIAKLAGLPDSLRLSLTWDQAVSLYLMSLFSYEWLRQEREKKEHPEQYQAATLPRVLQLANLEMQPGSEENSTRLQEKMDDLARKYGQIIHQCVITGN